MGRFQIVCFLWMVLVSCSRSSWAEPQTKERQVLNALKAAAPKFKASLEGVGLIFVPVPGQLETKNLMEAFLLGPQIAIYLGGEKVDLNDQEIYFRRKDGQLEVALIEKVDCPSIPELTKIHFCILGLSKEVKNIAPIRSSGIKPKYPFNLLILQPKAEKDTFSSTNSIQGIFSKIGVAYSIERAENYDMVVKRHLGMDFVMKLLKSPEDRISVGDLLTLGPVRFLVSNQEQFSSGMRNWEEKRILLEDTMRVEADYDPNSNLLTASRTYAPIHSVQDFVPFVEVRDPTGVRFQLDYPTQYFQEPLNDNEEMIEGFSLAFTFHEGELSWFGIVAAIRTDAWDGITESTRGNSIHFTYPMSKLFLLVSEFQNKYGYDGDLVEKEGTRKSQNQGRTQTGKKKKRTDPGSVQESPQKKSTEQISAELEESKLDQVEFEHTAQVQNEDSSHPAEDKQFPFLRKWYAGLTIKNKGNGSFPYSEVFYFFIRDQESCHFRVGLPSQDVIMGTHYLNKIPCSLDPQKGTLAFNYIDPKDDKVRVRLSLKWNPSREIFEETKKPKRRTQVKFRPLKNNRLLETYTWQELYGTTYQSPLSEVKASGQAFRLSSNKPVLQSLSGGWGLRHEADETAQLYSVRQNLQVGPTTLEIKCGTDKQAESCPALWDGVQGTATLRESFYLEDFALSQRHWTLHVSFPEGAGQLPISFLVYVDSNGRVLLGRPSKWARLGKARNIVRPGRFFKKIF